MSTTMRYCPECNNLVNPKEDREQKRVVHACSACEFKKVDDNNCDDRNEPYALHIPDESPEILRHMAADPTRARNKNVICERCNHREAIYYQAKPTGRRDEGLIMFYVCCNPDCGHRWRVRGIEFLRRR